ncbi:MAG: RluA family pseudouridine synthase [Limisphaerales bacterium]
MARPGPPVLKLSAGPRGYWEVAVLFEDEHLLALDKPSRLLTSPDRYDPERPNLMRLLHTHVARGAPWARERGITYLANAHRLDFETSGVILLAKHKPALVALANDFGGEKPEKLYLALATGAPAEDAFEVDAPLGPHPAKPGVVRVDWKRGKKSRTGFRVLERFAGCTWLECRPFTGRTHQVRAHLGWRKLPLVADEAYGGTPLLLSRLKPGYHHKRGEAERPLIGRCALHAWRLTLRHPMTGAPFTVEAPPPDDLAVALKFLRRHAAVPPPARPAAAPSAGGGPPAV